MKRKLRIIWNIILGRPVMYRMRLLPERKYHNGKYYNVVTILNKKSLIIENQIYRGD
jgi:hypothetical protein